MVARTQLAILDHNANVGRKQAEIKKGASQGEKRYKIACGKQRKNWVAKGQGAKDHAGCYFM